MEIRTKRIHDPAGDDDGARVLVDRLWPRGVRGATAAVDRWLREVVPSPELRRRFGHHPSRCDTCAGPLSRRADAKPEAVAELTEQAAAGPVTLLYAARDRACHHARVPADYLRELRIS